MDVQGNPFIKLDCCTKASWFLVTPDSTLREHLVGRGSEKKLQETGFHGGDVCIPTNGRGGGVGGKYSYPTLLNGTFEVGPVLNC